jgi:tetratricopeptide (TPR) repeat protein
LVGVGLSSVPAVAAEGDGAPTPAAPESNAVRRGDAYGDLMVALLAARRGDVAGAMAGIQRALERVPDSPDLLVASAELMLQWTGRTVEAERLARRAVELAPEHTGAVRLLAELAAVRALDPRGDESSRAEAIRLFEQLQQDPEERTSSLEALAQLRVRAGDLEGAILDVRQLLELRPGDSRAVQMLAQLLLRTDREKDALLALLEFVSSHPDSEDLFDWTEQLATTQEAWPEVVDYLVTRAPFAEDATLLNRFHGEALLRVGRIDEAVDALERSASGNPQDRETRKYLALAYRGQGRLAEAARLFGELAADSPPDAPLLHRLLGETFAEQNDTEAALDAFGKALRALEGRSDVVPSYRDAVRERIATLLFDGKDPAEAARVLDDLEAAPGVVALEIRCRIAMAERDWEEAERLAQAIEEGGEVGRARLIEGEIAVAERKWGKAASRFEEAIERLGPYARATVADVYRKADRPQDGLRLLEAWSAESPALADARFHLGVYHYELDRFEEAERELREAFRLDPDHARALNFLGYSLAERKVRLDEALGMIERALEVDAWNGAYLDSLGWVYYQMGRFEDARRPLERAALELPRDPVVLEHLGDVYLAVGRVSDAVAVWDRALEASPEDPESLRGKILRAGLPSPQLAADEPRPPDPAPR